MASGSNNLTTYYAKRIIGDTNAQSSATALLQTGTGIAANLWILGNTVHDTYGIRYSYDGDNSHDKLEAWGGGNAPTAWVQLDTGNTYIMGQVGIGYDPNTSGNTYKLYVNGTGYFSNDLIAARGLFAAYIELSSATPYIDFHFDSSSADYTSRIIESASGYLQIPGNFGVGGQNTSYKFYVNGTSYLKGDTTIVGNVSFGASNTSNYISIHGLTGDAADTQWANHYFIGNRHWGSTESSELVLFAGNDIGNGDNANTASGSGPDRIRYIGGAHLFQTYSSAVSGTFETVCTSSALVNIFEVNTNRLFSYKNLVFNDANVGIQRVGRSVSWIGGRDGALIRETSSPGYHALASIKTTNGSWEIGAYDNSSYLNKLIFSYATDANYNAGSNSTSAYTIDTSGHYSGNAASATKLQTARNLWGNSFNGTADISGSIYLGAGNDLYMKYNNTNYDVVSNYNNGNVVLTACGGGLYLGYTNTTLINFINGKASLNSSGYLTTADSIQVSRSAYTDGGSYIRITSNSKTVGLHVGSGGTNRGLYDWTKGDWIVYCNSSNVSTLNGNCTGSSGSCTGNAATATSSPRLSSSGYQDTCLSYYQTSGSFDGNSGWCHYIIANHGAGSSYYHYTLGLPFWDVPMYRRQTGSTSSVTSWYKFITAENIGSQSVNYASSAGNADTVDSWHRDDIRKGCLSFTRNMNGANPTNLNNLNDGMAYNYSSGTYWSNAPSSPTYGSCIALTSGGTSTLGAQFYWDINHNSSSSTRSLWFRAANNLGWQNDWKQIVWYNSSPTFNYLTINAQGGAEGGELKLAASSSGYPAALDVYTNLFRVVSTADRFHVNLANGTHSDYAEGRAANSYEPGRVYNETNECILVKTNARLISGCSVCSDTYGTSIPGFTQEDNIPFAVAGRVLVYTYQNRNNYQAGMAVCSAPGGTVDIMTREEIKEYPDCILGYVAGIPDPDKWSKDDVELDGRIWIRIN